MRFLHIADLHLGKILNDLSFIEDQRYILKKITETAISERINAVLIAGDIYQKTAPSAEAMALFDGFITGLIREGLKVFIISGNHDSPQRVSYLSSIVRESGVYVSDAFAGSIQQIRLADEYGDICISLMPFLRPSDVRRAYPDETISTYEDAIAAVMAHNPIDQGVRNVMLCHQFITGAQVSDSEELAVGGLDQISAELFDEFDYVALGHLHRPQRVRRDTVRYAGTPLKYSFSEVNDAKSVTIIDMRIKGDIELRNVPLTPIKDMRLVEGMLEDIMKMPYSEDYVWVTVNDEIVPPDAKLDILTVFPNMMKFSISNSRTREDFDIQAAESVENKDIHELFTDFFRLINNDKEPAPEHIEVLDAVLKRLEDRRNEAG